MNQVTCAHTDDTRYEIHPSVAFEIWGEERKKENDTYQHLETDTTKRRRRSKKTWLASCLRIEAKETNPSKESHVDDEYFHSAFFQDEKKKAREFLTGEHAYIENTRRLDIVSTLISVLSRDTEHGWSKATVSQYLLLDFELYLICLGQVIVGSLRPKTNDPLCTSDVCAAFVCDTKHHCPGLCLAFLPRWTITLLAHQ